MFDRICSTGFFLVIVFLSIVSTIINIEYMDNVANAIAIPVFLLSILDFITRIKNNTIVKIKGKMDIASTELTWITPYCNLAEKNPEDSENEKCFLECKHIVENIKLFDNEINKIKKWYSWCMPIYTVMICITFLLAVLANFELVKSVTSNINSTALTLWTLSVFLLDGVFGEYLCNKLMVKAEVNVKEGR